MKTKLFTYISNLTLFIGAALCVYVIIDFIMLKSRAPEGACPLTDNKAIIFIAIAFLVASFVFSVIEQKQKKLAKREEKIEDSADDTEKQDE